MRRHGLLMKLLAPMGLLVLTVAMAGNEEADCIPASDPPEIECASAVDCEGLPHELCLDGGWQCIDGDCQYKCEPVKLGCYSDNDCPGGQHCSVSDGDCQPDPSCPMCAVCYGECVPDETECVQSGCSGEVCSDKAVYTDCVWLPWFACLEFTSCGTFGDDGACGFDQNDEFLDCVAGTVECTTDMDCPDGFVCENDTWCGDPDSWCIGGGKCVKAPDPEGCEIDADCLPYEFCDHSPWDEMVGCCVPLDADGTGCPEGYPVCPGECKMKPGMCFDDADCKMGEHCELVDCVPGMDCGADWPGQCMPDQPLKCQADADCAPGLYCAVLCGNGWCEGQCEPVPPDQCVKDADCPKGLECVKEACPACYPCPCFGTCEDPGLPPGQCWTDKDCESDEYCDVMKCDPATGEKCLGPYECKPKPIEGCLSDADCMPYEYCDFIVYDGSMDCCPPNAFCDANIPPCEGGECRLLPDHCWTDADCGYGQKCEGVLITNCGDPTDPDVNCGEEPWPGKCVDDKPECLSDDECPPGHVCVLETWCPPCYDEDPPCLAPCTMEGHCEPAPSDTCFDDTDCGKDEFCDFTGVDTTMCCLPGELCLMIFPPCEGTCKTNGLGPGECWDDGDCKPGEHCEGAIICPPGAYCFAPDSPGECVPDQTECVAVKPGSHGACEMLLGVIFDGEKCVYESGCGCWPDCDNIFDSFEACEKACQAPPPPGDCISNEDCPAGEYCDLMGETGTEICIDCDPNDPDCAGGCFPMGTCQPMEDGVCVKDADCQPWQKCAFIYPCPLCLGCPCFGVCQDLPD